MRQDPFQQWAESAERALKSAEKPGFRVVTFMWNDVTLEYRAHLRAVVDEWRRVRDEVLSQPGA